MDDMTGQATARFHSYPMGPHLRAYLGIGDDLYTGATRQGRSDAEAEALTQFLAAYHGQVGPLSPEGLVDLIDELVAMDLPEAALGLVARYPEEVWQEDFRARLALGIAAMLTGHLELAEEHLREAQSLMPEEPAPYTNLVQIFLNQARLPEAETWCLAGLDAEPNNFMLWDLLALVFREAHGEYMPETLLALAEKRCSWAGISLAANLMTTGDRYLKAGLLERLHNQGEREPQFLVELTGAYGIAGDFAKIPPLVWQAERLASKGLPWQLHMHCAQAHLSLGQADAALTQLRKAETDGHLPEEARHAMHELASEARDMLAEEVASALH